ncbi:hypothetical protein UFOVP185_45 [uncultured Caudovirales phage]|uniref:Uncharacterized protein n=1 Tax=uncultured Caudovirales phage TaxID=2100421 RepID=A0A6J7WJS8_9CAUD|nr:hypothetical protein UFOVP185_45 [uncultured Caudovirales phage]
MNLEEITPIIEKIVKETLRERRYPFGGRPNSLYNGLSNKVASATLINSVKVNTIKQNDVSGIEIDIAPYGLFVDEGRRAGSKEVPVSAIMQWLGERGINVRDERGRFVKGHRKFKKQYEEAKQNNKIVPAAFAIQKSIKRFGVRASNFTEMAMFRISENKQIMDLLEGQAIEDLLNLINVSSTVK